MRNNLGIVLKRSRSSQSYSQTTLLVFPTVNVRKKKYKTRYRKCVTAARQARASSWRWWWCRNHGSGLVTWHIRGTRIRFEADIAPNTVPITFVPPSKPALMSIISCQRTDAWWLLMIHLRIRIIHFLQVLILFPFSSLFRKELVS